MNQYNTVRPHQALGMACPADRFDATDARAEQDVLPLRLPAAVRLATVPQPRPEPHDLQAPPGSQPPVSAEVPAADPVDPVDPVAGRAQPWTGGAVEFERVVPASGNMQVARKQFWLGPARAGVPVTFWADTEVIHLMAGGARIKSLRSHLSTADLAALAAQGGRQAGPPPLPQAEAGPDAVEVERTVNTHGIVGLGGRQVLAANILGGHRVGIRIKATTLMFFDIQTRELLRTRSNPLTWEQVERLHGLRPAGPPPRVSTAPVTVQRRASATGVFMVCGQRVSIGRVHAGQIVTVHVTDTTLTLTVAGQDLGTIRRTTTTPVRNIKADRPTRKAGHVS